MDAMKQALMMKIKELQDMVMGESESPMEEMSEGPEMEEDNKDKKDSDLAPVKKGFPEMPMKQSLLKR